MLSVEMRWAFFYNIDSAKLKEEKPEIFEEFKKTTESRKVKVTLKAV